MAIVSMKALLETGVHFGHRTRRWDPKMKPYIFTERNGIHILDLQQTIVMIEDAYNLIRDTVAEGGVVLFVGTKRQAQDTIEYEARRAGQPFVNQRWLGGTLTNWRTIKQRIDYLHELEERQEEGEFDLLKKKERLRVEREINKLNTRLGGIREMTDLPDLLFIVDVSYEDTAVREANILRIPIIGVVDTNSDPDDIDFIIPSNDDAIRAIKLICSKMADAALEGAAIRRASLVEETEQDIIDMETYTYDEFDEDASDEDLLGASTLAKLREEAQESAAETVQEAVEATPQETESAVTAEDVATEAEDAPEDDAEASEAEEADAEQAEAETAETEAADEEKTKETAEEADEEESE
jgi:small subunit ribosomal protein S2